MQNRVLKGFAESQRTKILVYLGTCKKLLKGLLPLDMKLRDETEREGGTREVMSNLKNIYIPHVH